MIGTLARVLTGFVVACLVAGLVQVLYLSSTYGLASSPDSTFPGSLVIERVLLVATHSAIFAAAFALIATGVAEWMGYRSLPYYLIAGAVIAMLGFIAQFSSEQGGPTILNNYALQAYVTSGFFAGLAYWLMSGHRAGGKASDHDDEYAGVGDATNVLHRTTSWKKRPRITVDPSPDDSAARVSARSYQKKSLSERLKRPEPDAPPAGDQAGASKAAEKNIAPPATSVPSTKAKATAASGRDDDENA